MMRNASLGLLLFLLAVPPQFAHPAGSFSEGALVSVLDRAVQASMAGRSGTAELLEDERALAPAADVLGLGNQLGWPKTPARLADASF